MCHLGGMVTRTTEIFGKILSCATVEGLIFILEAPAALVQLVLLPNQLIFQ